MTRRRRAPISNHPLTPKVTTVLTFAAVAVLVVVSDRLGMFGWGKGQAVWAVVFMTPVNFLYFSYDPITMALDRLVSKD